MDKMKLQNSLSRIENLIPKRPTEIKSNLTPKGTETDKQATFDETLSKVLDAGSGNGLNAEIAKPVVDGKPNSNLKFSNHAIERMQTRGISYDPERLQKLDQAIQKAASKGSKDTLVLMDDSALIVSVKNNTVVTVMDKNSLRENVFTNIDSTVVI